MSMINPRKLFIHNIDFAIEQSKLHELFEKFGQIQHIDLPKHQDGKPKGIAFVEYKDEKSAEEAQEAMNEK